jgi:serine/threonine-protein kinase
MRERFAEVIEVHKETLSQCLKAGGTLGISPSTIERLVEQPMITPTGMSPLAGVAPSVTPTPTPAPLMQALPPPPALPRGMEPPPAQENKKGGLVWKIAVVVALVLLAAVAALAVPLLGGEEADAGAIERPVIDVTAPVAAVVEPPPPMIEQPVEEPVEQPVAIPDVVAPVEPTADTAPRASEERAGLTASERRRIRRQRSETPAAAEPEPAAPSGAPGFLTLVTTPWTRVRLGARDLGTTPLIRLELPPGTHTLHLENPEQGITDTYRVTITSGETVTRRLGLR